jgi:hypothetical protein
MAEIARAALGCLLATNPIVPTAMIELNASTRQPWVERRERDITVRLGDV